MPSTTQSNGRTAEDWPADALTEPGSPWGPYGILLRLVGPTTAIVEEDVVVFGRLIRKGFITDGASMPGRLARYTDMLPAALPHDDRYDPYAGPGETIERDCTREQADDHFRRDNIATFDWIDRDTPRWRRAASRAANRLRATKNWMAVRAAGWRPWNAGTRRGIKNVGDQR